MFVSLPDDFPAMKRRVPIRGAFLGTGRWSNMDQMTKTLPNSALVKLMSILLSGKAVNIDDDLVKQLLPFYTLLHKSNSYLR